MLLLKLCLLYFILCIKPLLTFTQQTIYQTKTFDKAMEYFTNINTRINLHNKLHALFRALVFCVMIIILTLFHFDDMCYYAFCFDNRLYNYNNIYLNKILVETI